MGRKRRDESRLREAGGMQRGGAGRRHAKAPTTLSAAPRPGGSRRAVSAHAATDGRSLRASPALGETRRRGPPSRGGNGPSGGCATAVGLLLGRGCHRAGMGLL